MKKLLFVLIASLGLLSFVFAYTSTDIENANFLADQGIIVKQSTNAGYRFDSTITRAEVIGMALKLKGVTLPENYTCKKYFSDTQNNDWICRALEIGADEGIITRSNVKGRPSDTITRAEALAIVMKAGAITIEPFDRNYFTQHMGESDVNWTDANQFGANWQRDVFFSFKKHVQLEIPGQGNGLTSDEGSISYSYRPNMSATRSEVFGFARNIQSSNTIHVNQTYQGFTADFVGEKLNISHKDPETTVYAFGNIELGGELVHEFSLSVQPRYGSVFFDSTESIEKKSWNGQPYYVTMDNGMCYTGRLIFVAEKNMISVSGSCNQTIEEVENALRRINFELLGTTTSFSGRDILSSYYVLLQSGNIYEAFVMRSPAGVSLKTFESWYKDVSKVKFREDTLKSLGDNTYEFLVDITEGGIKSTYKVKSKVDLENFTIDNISSIKQ